MSSTTVHSFYPKHYFLWQHDYATLTLLPLSEKVVQIKSLLEAFMVEGCMLLVPSHSAKTCPLGYLDSLNYHYICVSELCVMDW